MIETIDITVQVTHIDPLDGTSPQVREIVQAVVDGEIHPLIEMVEMLQFKTDDEATILPSDSPNFDNRDSH